MEWVGELEDLEADVCFCMVLQGEVSLDGRTMCHVMSQTFSKTEKTCVQINSTKKQIRTWMTWVGTSPLFIDDFCMVPPPVDCQDSPDSP